jgi:hypothetical protein
MGSAYAKASADTFSPKAKKWWTRSQSNQTAEEMQFVVKLLDAEDGPVYQRLHQRRCG